MTLRRLIRGATLATSGRVADVLIEAGRITEVGAPQPPLDLQSGDTDDCLIWPGWIDQHMHGIVGVPVCVRGPDSISECIDRLSQMSALLPRYGITGFLPTCVAQPIQNLEIILRAVRMLESDPPKGARILGVNLEGLFLAPEASGAHDKRYLSTPREIGLDRLLELGKGRLPTLMTVAPEIDGALDFIAAAVAHGASIAIGHTLASSQCVIEALAAGAACATHFGNAMGTFHQREPGAIGAFLAHDTAFLEVIPNRAMLHPLVWKLVWDLAGERRTILVSDAMPSTGAMSRDRYDFGGTCVVDRGGVVHRVADGRVWGNSVSYLETLTDFMRSLSLSPPEVAASVSKNQSQFLHIDGLGDIAPGYKADLVLTTDKMSVAETLVGGETVYGPTGSITDRH